LSVPINQSNSKQKRELCLRVTTKRQDEDAPFPTLRIPPNIPESDRKDLLVDLRGLEELGLDEVNGEELYRGCVKVLYKDTLINRKDTPWRVKLGLDDKVKPAWRTLYRGLVICNGGC
jgi:hypothetical protein